MTELPPQKMQPGQRLARSICRHLLGYDFVSIEEFTPERGKRVDVMALGPKGEIWVVDANPAGPIFGRIVNGGAIWLGATVIFKAFRHIVDARQYVETPTTYECFARFEFKCDLKRPRI